ncbi:hypothetical protein WQ54_04090 [Bacillus sp. SA1-12]|uniref:hypothetical protein n=1 Tax=Bacillus sp. SA1-12 TaxID=1455638 RepID=UPI000625BF20|nr:hypothetical protein [Bacillus sp. SA1-12]KKI93426.1 hypothetical protein WQ54_04090 [Bacillus sp. SA1-12]
MYKQFFSLFIFILLFLTGCSSVPQQSKEYLAANGVSEENIQEQKLISAQATFIGLMDPHTIEVIVNDKPMALQITEEQRKILEPLEMNKEIHIEYWNNEKTSQKILKKVEIME